MGSQTTTFDYTGEAEFWNGIPLRTTKKFSFLKNGTVQTLGRLFLNSVLYDFNKTAQGGVVVVANDYSVIEFISPDDRIDYDHYKEITLGESLSDMETVCSRNPIQAWDKFAAWLGGNTAQLANLTGAIETCYLTTIDGVTQTLVNVPSFENITDMVTFLNMLKDTIAPAANQPLSTYQLDNYAFGCALIMTSYPDSEGETVTLNMGFMFRE